MSNYLLVLIIVLFLFTGSCTVFLHIEAEKAMRSFEETKVENEHTR